MWQLSEGGPRCWAFLNSCGVVLLLRCNWVLEFEWHSNLVPLGDSCQRLTEPRPVSVLMQWGMEIRYWDILLLLWLLATQSQFLNEVLPPLRPHQPLTGGALFLDWILHTFVSDSLHATWACFLGCLWGGWCLDYFSRGISYFSPSVLFGSNRCFSTPHPLQIL